MTPNAPLQIPLQTITASSFARFGRVLTHNTLPMGYEVLGTVESTGWLWAIYSYSNREVQVMECHPNSPMAIEPHSGMGILLVALPQQPAVIEAFVLDQAVLLREGVWHNLLALSETAMARVVQNKDLQTQFYQPQQPLRVAIVP